MILKEVISLDEEEEEEEEGGQEKVEGGDGSVEGVKADKVFGENCWLEVDVTPTGERQTISLDSTLSSLTIGRRVSSSSSSPSLSCSSSSDSQQVDKIVRFADPQLSRKHAKLLHRAPQGEKKDEWFLEDQKSLNQTYLNGEALTPFTQSRSLRNGDQLLLGQTHITFRTNDLRLGLVDETKENLRAILRCPVCEVDLEPMLVLDRELHLNKCLDEQLSEEKARKLVLGDATKCHRLRRERQGQGKNGEKMKERGGSVVLCVICGIDLAPFCVEERAIHTNSCLDKGSDQTRTATKHRRRTNLESSASASSNENGATKSRKKRPNRSQTKLQVNPLVASRQEAEKRIKRIDERIEQLNELRGRLCNFVENAKALEARLDMDADSNAATAFSRPLFYKKTSQPTSKLDLSLSSSSSESFGNDDPNTHEMLQVNETNTAKESLLSKTKPLQVNETNTAKESLWTKTKRCSKELNVSSHIFETSVLRKQPPSTPTPQHQESQRESHVNRMPAYENLTDLELQRLLGEYGMESGPRSYMLAELKRLWSQIHTDSSTGVEKDKTKTTNRSGKSPDEVNFAICNAITKTLQNEALYEDILLHKGVDLDTLNHSLKEVGVVVAQQHLMRFLDSHGITYRARSVKKASKEECT